MQLIGHSDLVIRVFFVFLWIMLFASVYLFLVKAVDLSCRAWQARRFLRSLARTRSLRQMQALVDGQVTIKSFSRVTHRILAEQRRLDAATARPVQAGDAQGAAAQRLIAQEAAEQAAQLRQGLGVLAAVMLLAPLTGLVSIVWDAGRSWVWSLGVDGAHGDLWSGGGEVMQLGLIVALVALCGYLCLRAANRLYLAQFNVFRRMVMPILEPDGNASACGSRSKSPRRSPRGRSGPGFQMRAAGQHHGRRVFGA